jgi:hypothetical protein
MVCHQCDEEGVNAVLDYIEQELYPEILKEEDANRAIEKSGELFWWICQAKPWWFGDPSIAEMLCKSILSSKGIEVSNWNPDLIPWAVVMETDSPKEFGKIFRTELLNTPSNL